MLDNLFNNLPFFGLGLGLVVLFCLLEVLLRSLTNRYGTPQMGR